MMGVGVVPNSLIHVRQHCQSLLLLLSGHHQEEVNDDPAKPKSASDFGANYPLKKCPLHTLTLALCLRLCFFF